MDTNPSVVWVLLFLVTVKYPDREGEVDLPLFLDSKYEQINVPKLQVVNRVIWNSYINYYKTLKLHLE